MDSSRGMDSMGSKSNQSLCYYLHVQVILQLRGFIACGSSCTRPEEDIRNGSKKHGVTAVNLLTEVLEERHVIGRPREQIGVVCSTKDCFQCAVLGQPYDIEETKVPRVHWYSQTAGCQQKPSVFFVCILPLACISH